MLCYEQQLYQKVSFMLCYLHSYHTSRSASPMLYHVQSHSIRGSVYHAVIGTESPHQEVCHATQYMQYNGGKGLTLYKILSSHMPCFLALFRNPIVQHSFDKSNPQSAIQKTTWNFVQGNGSKLNIKHNPQPTTIRAQVPTVYQPSASKSRKIPSLLLATSKALLRFSM